MSSYDTQVCGILTIVVSWMCGERIIKSETYCGEISRSISTSGEKPTPPFDGLIEQVCNAAIKTKEYADSAEAAAERAENAGGIAEDAAQRAETAAERAENAGGIAEETDPTVPAWAKQPTKPSYTADEVNARPADWKPTPQEIDAASAGDVVKLSGEITQLKGDLADLAPAGASVGQLFRVASVSDDGKYIMEPVDMPSGVDVQINGASIVQDGVANIPYASNGKIGVLREGSQLYLNQNGVAYAGLLSFDKYVSNNNNTFIGKGTLENVIDAECVRNNKAQTLTDMQKQQARQNIGINTVTQSEYDSLTDTSGIYIIVEE